MRLSDANELSELSSVIGKAWYQSRFSIDLRDPLVHFLLRVSIRVIASTNTINCELSLAEHFQVGTLPLSLGMLLGSTVARSFVTQETREAIVLISVVLSFSTLQKFRRAILRIV